MSTPTGTNPRRETVTTIREDGSRRFLYPADVHGRFTRARRLSGWAIIGLCIALPWIKFNGYPVVFLDLAAGRFHLLGLTFAAQDIWLSFFAISGLGFSLFIVTSLFGRLWCGWACPQTVLLEHVYRRIERLTEGDALARRQLAEGPFTADKFARRTLKHALYLLASVAIAHLFLAYFVSLPAVWSMMREAPAEHASEFGFIAAFTAVLYFNFAWFREQFCVVLCPYGRIQSALTDENTMVIGYDSRRGEPRGKLGTPDAGACVGCNRCVQVCPTGIDIRQGFQLECVGCAACIDACDMVMTRLHRPRGLIRYDSLNGLAGRATRWLRPRLIVYAVLLAIGATAALLAISTVRPVNVSVTRMTGAPFFVDAGMVRNQYLIRMVNKRDTEASFVLICDRLPAGVVQSGFTDAVTIPPLGEIVQPLILQQPVAGFTGPFAISIRVVDTAGKAEVERSVQFLGPDFRVLQQAKEEIHQVQPAP